MLTSSLLQKTKSDKFFLSNKQFFINSIIENIIDIYKPQNIFLPFSGGKDSTVLLHNTIETVLKIKKPPKITIIHCDTLIENPIIERHSYDFLKNLESFFKANNLNFEIVILKPVQTYWHSLIGKGYPLPNTMFRWCQRTLKIKPSEDYMKTVKDNDAVVFVGLRKDESKSRKNDITNNQLDNYQIKRQSKLKYFTPIMDLTETDIWEFLISNKTLWKSSYQNIIDIYKGARGECPLIPEISKKNSGCGSRFGCWMCTLVKKDKSLQNQSLDNEDLLPLINFREWTINFVKDDNNHFKYMRNGKPAKRGCLTFKARKKIFKELKDLEKRTGISVLSNNDLKNIKSQWKADMLFFKSRNII